MREIYGGWCQEMRLVSGKKTSKEVWHRHSCLCRTRRLLPRIVRCSFLRLLEQRDHVFKLSVEERHVVKRITRESGDDGTGLRTVVAEDDDPRVVVLDGQA